MATQSACVDRCCEVCGDGMSEWRIGPRSILLKCPSCGHIKRDISICEAKARKMAFVNSNRLDRIRLTLAYRRIHRLLSDAVPMNVLEIGCGDGTLLARFHADSHNVSAIEPNAGVQLVRALPCDSISIQRTTAEQADWPANHFDLILGLHVAEHLDAPALVFQKCFESLREGGRLYLITPCATSYGLKLFGENWWNLEDPTHVRFFSPLSARLILEKVGFGDVRTNLMIWDGLRVEANSMARRFVRSTDGVGIADKWWARAMCVGLLPFTFLGRLACPRLAPNMEIVARR